MHNAPFHAQEIAKSRSRDFKSHAFRFDHHLDSFLFGGIFPIYRNQSTGFTVAQSILKGQPPTNLLFGIDRTPMSDCVVRVSNLAAAKQPRQISSSATQRCALSHDPVYPIYTSGSKLIYSKSIR
jgi:hypothetical protein